jgi:hypothetical protein
MIAPELVEIGGASAAGDSSATQNRGAPPNVYLSIEAIEGWEPESAGMATGDEHAIFAVRCYAAAGLGNTAIAQRIRNFGAEPDLPNIERYDAVLALSRHCALVGVPGRQIVTLFAHLTPYVPGWPDDPKELAAITHAALQEVGR